MPGGKGNIRPEDGKQFGKNNKAAEKWTEEHALRLGNELITWMKAEDENIFFEDFLFLQCNEADYPGKIHKDLLSYLAKKFTSFSDLLRQARNIEEVKLKKYGAFDKLNASIVKFLLSAEYGLSEKTESKNEHTVNTIRAADLLSEFEKQINSEGTE